MIGGVMRPASIARACWNLSQDQDKKDNREGQEDKNSPAGDGEEDGQVRIESVELRRASGLFLTERQARGTAARHLAFDSLKTLIDSQPS